MAKEKKAQKASETMTVQLNVPRGLWKFLDKLQDLTGETPKDHLETLMRGELESIMNELSTFTFDLDFIRKNYGEGSYIHESTIKPEAAAA